MRKNLLTATVWVALTTLVACGQTPAAGGHAMRVASQADAPADVVKTITQKLESRYADQRLKVESVLPTPISGIYEVVVNNKQIAYTDSQGEYMLVGELVSTQDSRNLTEERQASLHKVDYAQLPFQYATKEVRGNGKLQVAVFSDPDCPFCKKLEHEFAKMTDVTIYNFMMPIASLHPQANEKSVQIMCQPNPTQAWISWMRENKVPPKVAPCEHHHVAETTALGEHLGFGGTPTIVFPNGLSRSGFAPMPQLEQLIKDNQK